MHYAFLAVAIVAEVIATNALKASNAFTLLRPSLVVVLGYGLAFYCLSQCLKTMDVSVTYAIWSGVGIVLVTAYAVWKFGEVPDIPAVIGMGLILAGVVIINLFSRTVPR